MPPQLFLTLEQSTPYQWVLGGMLGQGMVTLMGIREPTLYLTLVG